MTAEEILNSEDFRKCADFHGHVCGGLAIGYRAAKAGMELLAGQKALDEELVAVVETDACCVDAIQVLTGCTFGKGNLLYHDYGKMAFSFFNRNNGKGVRLLMHPDRITANGRQVELFAKMRSGTISDSEREELTQLGQKRTSEILEADLNKLFLVKDIITAMPDKARIAASKLCAKCGEPAMETKLKEQNGELVCRACCVAG